VAQLVLLKTVRSGPRAGGTRHFSHSGPGPLGDGRVL